MLRLVALLGTLVLTGCQSQEAAMDIVCNADQKCTACQGMSRPDAQREATVQYIMKNVSHAEVKKMLNEIRAVSPEEKKTRVLAAASQAGIDSCPMAEIFAAPPPE